MPFHQLIAGVLAGALLLAACGAPPPAPPQGGDAARFAVQLVADLDPDDAGAVAEAVNAFGFDLLTEVTDGQTNAVISPVSVATLLAMVLAGAGGDTAAAMAEVLHLDDARDVRVGALLRQLADTDDVTVSVANALWANQGTPFEEDYVAFVRDTFDATVAEADLGAQATADDIDAWVVEHTEGLIEGIAEELGVPDPQAVLVLLNAVYFLGQWTTQFDPGDTRVESFTLPGGETAPVPLMHLSDQTFGYAERSGYRVLRLPYGDDGRYGMEVFLPDGPDALPRLLERLDGAEWRAAVDALDEHQLDLVALPRFELGWEATLTDSLTRLGMGVAFGPESDFRPMSPTDPWLDVVAHKTFIRVDEEGTEAAAVTGGVMRLSAGPDPLVFRVDRPFAFTISDADSGTILFLGAVTDPRG